MLIFRLLRAIFQRHFIARRPLLTISRRPVQTRVFYVMSEILKQAEGKWTEENTNAALKLFLEDKITQRQTLNETVAAQAFNVPKRTNAKAWHTPNAHRP